MNTAVLSDRIHKGLRNIVKPVAIVSILFVFYALAGFWILPTILQNRLPMIVLEEAGREVALEKIAINPFTLEAFVKGFEMKETDGQTFAAFNELYIDIAGFDSIIRFKPVIEKITLIEPFVRIARDSKGNFNFADMTEEPSDKSEDAEDEVMAAFRLRSLAISDGAIVYEDLQSSELRKETLGSIDLSISELNSVDSEPAPLQFSFVSDSKSALDWQGSITLKPLQSQGSIKLENVDLPQLGRLFLQEAGDIKIGEGRLHLSIDYSFNADQDGFNADIKPVRLNGDSFKMNIAPAPGQVSEIAASSLQFEAEYELKMTGGDLTVNSVAPNRISADNFSLTLPIKADTSAAVAVKSVNLGADTTVSMSDNSLKIAADTAKLAVEGFNLKPSRQSAGIPELSARTMTFEADYAAESSEHGLRLNIRQSRFDLNALKMVLKPHDETLEAQLTRFAAVADIHIDPDAAVRIEKAKIDINDLQFGTDEDRDLINIPSITVSGITADTGKQRVKIASIASKDAQLKAWLEPDGEFNYLRLFGEERNEATTTTQAPESKPWQFALDNFMIDRYRITFTDKSQKAPVDITLSDLSIGADQLTDRSAEKFPVRLQSKVNESGSVAIEGQFAPDPLSAELKLNVDRIALKTFQPYLESHVLLDLIEGDFSAHGQISLLFTEQNALDLKFQGDSQIDRLVTRDQVQRRDFVKWRKLGLGRIAIDLAANRYEFEDIRFDRPYLRVLIKKDGTTNFSDIIPASETVEAEQRGSELAAPIHYRIGRIEVRRGLSDFADYSLILPFITQMNNLDGVVSGISSEPGAVAELSLQGKVYNLADVGISGSYRLDSGDSAIELKFKDMPLPLVTPYMAEFAGYKIERGQMSLDLKYTIDQGKLNAQNNLFIDQFTLGEKVENPKAVSLPLNLAIALLKDSKGQINLDLPITGSLDDPEFSVGGLIMKTLGNLITRVATSPFRAIASLFAEDQDLSVVNFAPGSATLDKTEQEKLDALAKALREKTALKLEIKGAAYEEHDWPALRKDALTDQLKSMRAKELRAEGRRIRAEYVTLSEDEEQRLLAQLFIDKFPLLAEYSFFGRPRLKDSEQGEFYEIARQKLEAALEPDPQRLNALAVLRAGAISNYLIAEGKIPGNRIFLLATELDPVKKEPGITVTLSLGMR